MNEKRKGIHKYIQVLWHDTRNNKARGKFTNMKLNTHARSYFGHFYVLYIKERGGGETSPLSDVPMKISGTPTLLFSISHSENDLSFLSHSFILELFFHYFHSRGEENKK